MSERGGIALDEGRTLLRAAEAELWWRGRTGLLVAGCEQALPVVHSRPGDAQTPPGRARRFALAFEGDEPSRQWAASIGAELLIGGQEETERIEDKLALDGLARAAGVEYPRSVAIEPGEPSPSAWERGIGIAGQVALVVQRRSNRLGGAGTQMVTSAAELDACRESWPGETLKLAEHVAGLPLSVTACAGPDRTIVSVISHQLAGVERLTPHWGAHCGNQLVADDELPTGAADRIRDACERVGDELRRRGHRGMFGLDLQVGEDGRPVVIEINARIQGVTPLASAAELESGLMPLPAAHVLAATADRFPPSPAERATPQLTADRPLSQLFVFAREPMRVSGDLRGGLHALVGGELHRQADERSGWITSADPHEAVFWPFPERGESVAGGEKLVVIQFRRRVAPLDASRQLDPWTEEWIAACERALAGNEGR